MTLKKKTFKFPLYLQILAGMITGILIGIIALPLNGEKFISSWIAPWGQLFIRLLQLIAIPLVFVSLVRGITGLKSVQSFSKMGVKTVALYIITTCFAVVFGISMGLLVKPGKIVDTSKIESLSTDYINMVETNKEMAEKTTSEGPLNFLNDIVPANIINAAADNTKMLQIIFFAAFFGIAMLAIPKEKTKTVSSFFDGLYEIILRMVDYVIRFAPFGVAAMMAGLVVNYGGNIRVFAALGAYAFTVVLAMLIMIFAFYPLMLRVFTRFPVKKFLKKMYPVQLLAFTTSSSSATLPFTMETVEQELNVSPETASFVLPIGSTINMDGTSCYQAIAILFIAQLLGVDLGFTQLLVIIAMTILSSIGTPGIPGGSYVIMTIVLTAVGIPPEGLAIILGIDRPLDMLRTAVNVTGDATVALIIDKGNNN